MHCSKLATLSAFVFSAMHIASASPAGLPVGIVTDAQLDHWIATTDSNLIFLGGAQRRDEPVTTMSTRVVYCNKRTDNACGGDCTVYNGQNACLYAVSTQCLSATNNVSFCNREGCGGTCNELKSCNTRLDNGFCYTPGTRSINVPF